MLTLALDKLLRPEATAYALTLAQLAEADELSHDEDGEPAPRH